jgi:hypothetical protein
MNPTHRFVHAIQYCVAGLFLLLATSSNLSAQVETPNNEVPVQITLKPDKKTIMLGEPMFIAFAVTNVSGEKLCLGVGGDYRNKFGRPESFKVAVSAEDGTAVPQPEAINTGGFIGCEPIDPGATYTVRLFLQHWATITRPGLYRINVKRNMGFSNYEPGSTRPKYSMLADLNAEFIVVPANQNEMGAIINSLGSVMLDSSDPAAANAATALAWIEDKRVISYFAEAVRKFGDVDFASGRFAESFIGPKAIAVLGVYDDDRAIEALEAAMKSQTEDTRENVATAFCVSPHKSAIKLLLKMQDDSYWRVRLRVAQGLKVKTKESRAVLEKLLKDENEDVRNAAKEGLKNFEQ